MIILERDKRNSLWEVEQTLVGCLNKKLPKNVGNLRAIKVVTGQRGVK